ncbi:copper resistance protein NlpE N-terminal domain-containing protein [Halomonas sp. A29]|uniref:copper resistance protein NlpE N-terminal domain-containing protein n=1 Tax=Halomonas sp. A29 TaxID=3102786 RepID=UPI00398B068A
MIGLLALGLGGCASMSNDASEESFESVARFVGTLPCIDCRIIRADLTLHRDPETGRPDKYFLQQTHVDAIGGDFTSTQWGDWRLMSTGESVYYHIESQASPIVLRVEEEGQRLGWVADRELSNMSASYELMRTEPLR